jgi:phthiodiolone/phenolphthiodiolone dimycocerosates ketoreductase
VKVGINLPSQFPFDSTQQMMEVYQQVGFDSYWAPDHILGVFHPGLWSEIPLSDLAADPDAFYDPFCYGAVVGTMTDKPFGISVTDSTRRGAADLARAALTLNDLNPGGFILGIGSGEAESLLPFGYPFDRPVSILEDVLRDLRSLLDTGRMADGGLGRMGLPLEAEGRGRPPVWVAGHGPRMLRLTGQYGDGWIPAWWMTPEEYGEKRQIIADHAAAADRPAPENSLLPFCLFCTSKDAAAEMFEREPLGKLFGLFAMGHMWERHGLEHPLGNDSKGFVDVVIHGLDADELRDIAPTIPFEMVCEVLFVGNADELAGQFEAYARNGLEHVVLANLTGVVGGMDEIMARAMDLPALRAALADL